MINEIAAQNFKGKSFQYQLTEKNIITGPNGAGKTAIREAIILAILGEIPGQPKTNQGIMEYASGDQMEVAAKIGSETFIRGWKRTKSKVSKNEDVPEKQYPIFTVDPMDWYGRGSAQKLSMLLERVEGESEQRIETLQGKMRALRVDGHDTDHQEALDDCLESIGEVKQSRFAGWLDEAESSLKEILRECKNQIKRYEETVRGITQMQIGEDVAGDPAVLKSQSERAEKEFNEAKSNHSQAKQLAEFYSESTEELQARIKSAPAMDEEFDDEDLIKAQDNLEMLEGEYQKAQEIKTKRDGLKKQIADYSAQKKSLMERLPDIDAIKKQVERADAAIKANDDFEARIKSAESKREDLKAKLSELTAERDDILAKDECPICGSCIGDMKAKIEEEYSFRIDSINDQLKELEIDLEAFRARRQDPEILKDQRTLAKEKLDDANSVKFQIERAEELVIEANQQLAELPKDECESIKENIDAIKKVIANLERIASQGISPEEINRIKKTLEARGNLDELEKVKESKEQALEAAKDALKKAEQAAADERRVNEANQNLEKEKAKKLVLDQAIKLIAEERKLVMNEAISPLIDTVNKFTAGIIPSANYSEGEIYYQHKDGYYIPARLFSGAEEIVFFAGLQAALAVFSGMKVVIIDEASRMTEATKEKFAKNLNNALDQGIIDQYLVIDIYEDEWLAQSPGANVIHA
jgi:DNA repair exonuclease SbcCD ATPase subunit